LSKIKKQIKNLYHLLLLRRHLTLGEKKTIIKIKEIIRIQNVKVFTLGSVKMSKIHRKNDYPKS